MDDAKKVHTQIGPLEAATVDVASNYGRPQMGSADLLEKWMKNKKSENMQKEQISMFMLYFESNQGRQL